MHHVVKSWPEYFEPLMTGAKTFDLRRNDRDYQVGDLITLKEYEPRDKAYSGREITKRISCLMHGVGVGAIEPLKGLGLGYVILQLMDTSQQ
jgi:hypothetical protein